MKKSYYCFIALLFALLPMSVNAQKGEKTMGVMAGYNTRNQSGVAGLYFQYRFSKHVRLAPDFQYTFQHNNLQAFAVNGNFHFPFALDTRLNFYPLVGVTYQGWRKKLGSDDILKKNRFGGNFGGGFEYMATPTMKISVEGKYSWIKNYPNATFVVGLGYLF